MRQTEYAHNTREQVRDYLQTAADIVAELDIAPDLIPHAFVQAVGLVSAKQVVLEQVGLGMAISQGNKH